MRNAITLAITGASGAPYAIRLLQVLAELSIPVYCLFSDTSKVVLKTEYDTEFPDKTEHLPLFFSEKFSLPLERMHFIDNNDWFSCIASGSAAPSSMVICPCSMGTLSAVATGASHSLLERAAAVAIKERHNLILVARESPVSAIHLQQMTDLAKLGVCILPASPSFYHSPQTIQDLIDSVVQRILNQLNIHTTLIKKWGTDAGL